MEFDETIKHIPRESSEKYNKEHIQDMLSEIYNDFRIRSILPYPKFSFYIEYNRLIFSSPKTTKIKIYFCTGKYYLKFEDKKIIEISGVYSEREEAKKIIAEIIKKYLENNN